MTKQELAAKIWATANVLRKNIKASEYKDYILGFMFYKYLSDQEVNYIKDSGGTREDLQNVTNENIQLLRDRLGYFIAYDDLFSSWQTLGKKLGAQIVTEAIDRFYQSLNKQSARVFYVYHLEVDHHSGVFNALDAGLSKLGENLGSRDKAVRDIIDLVAQIPTQSRSYDVLGYIYEYLIREFSSEAKKDGAFYTPHELTSLMARIIAERLKDRNPNEDLQVYDPCVGTAGLLLNIGTEIGKYHDKDHIRYYGQELITETSNLAKMNLFMKEISYENLIIRNADTLDEDWPIDPENHCGPLYVDAVTANPPYSAHWDRAPHERRALPPVRPGPVDQGRPRLLAPLPLPHQAGRHRGHRPAAWCPLPRRCRRRDPQEPHREQQHRDDHRPAVESLLLDRHPRHRHDPLEEPRRK